MTVMVTGWLTVMVRGVDAPIIEVSAASSVEAEGVAANADHEEQHARA